MCVLCGLEVGQVGRNLSHPVSIDHETENLVANTKLERQIGLHCHDADGMHKIWKQILILVLVDCYPSIYLQVPGKYGGLSEHFFVNRNLTWLSWMRTFGYFSVCI